MRVFVLTKRWAEPCCADREQIRVFQDYDKAKAVFTEEKEKVLSEEYEDGPELMIDDGKDFLEVWIDGEYSDTHTSLELSGYDVE